MLRRGRLHRIPEGLTAVPTKPAAGAVIADLTARQGAVLGDFCAPAAYDADESLEAFMTRRLGGEVYANLIEPLMAGIYAGDGSALSIQATFPQLRQAERGHGGLIRACWHSRRRRSRRRMVSGPGSSLSGTVSASWSTPGSKYPDRGGEIQLGAAVSLLERYETGYRDDRPTEVRKRCGPTA